MQKCVLHLLILSWTTTKPQLEQNICLLIFQKDALWQQKKDIGLVKLPSPSTHIFPTCSCACQSLLFTKDTWWWVQHNILRAYYLFFIRIEKYYAYMHMHCFIERTRSQPSCAIMVVCSISLFPTIYSSCILFRLLMRTKGANMKISKSICKLTIQWIHLNWHSYKDHIAHALKLMTKYSFEHKTCLFYFPLTSRRARWSAAVSICWLQDSQAKN